MHTQFIITFVADDRPGLVEAVAEVISGQGGNWLESRLVQLAGRFAGLIQVSLPAASEASLRTALESLDAAGISVRITPCGGADSVAGARSTEGSKESPKEGAKAGAESGRTVHLSVLGPDRPGIVREIAAALGARAINVVDMETSVSPAPMSAEPLFRAHIEAEAPRQVDLGELGDTLDTIAGELGVDLSLEAGQGDGL